MSATEPLEVRTLLAGNVLVSFNNAKLTLKGDSKGNCVRVDEASNGPRVVGCSIGNGPTTTVNGQPLESFVGTTQELSINMKSGHDRVLVELLIEADVDVKMGSGEDYLRLDQDIRGDARVNLGSGNDTLMVDAIRIGGDVAIKTGSGPKAPFDPNGTEREGVEILGSTIEGKTNVRGGGGNQLVTIEGTDFEQDATFSLGGGADAFVVGDNGTLFLVPPKMNGGGGTDFFANAGNQMLDPDRFEVFA